MFFYFFFTDEKLKSISGVIDKVRRNRFPLLYNALNKSNLTIVGLRQIGKTTIAKQLAKQYALDNNINWEGVLYLNIKSMQNPGIEKLSTDIISLENVKLFVIDEIQDLPNWNNFIQSISDYRNDAKFIFTGSNITELTERIPVGRSQTFYLNPLSFDEYKKIWNDHDFEKYMMYGSQPHNKNFNTVEEQYPIVANDMIIEKVVSEDHSNIVASEKFRRFLKDIVNYIGNELKISKVMSESSIKIETKQKYLNILHRSNILQSIGKYKDKNQRIKHKVYFNDKSMMYLFLNFEKLNGDKFGSLIENIIFNALDNKFNIKYADQKIQYFRNINNSEVDFVIEDEKLLVESKYTDSKSKIVDEIENLSITIGDSFYDFKKIIVTNGVSLKYKGWQAIPLLNFLKMYK